MKELKRETPKAVGHRLSVLRERRGWSQRELARRLGVSPPTIQKIEAGDQALNADLIPLLAKTLRVTPADFFSEEPPCDQGPSAQLARVLARSWNSFPPEERRFLEEFFEAIRRQREHDGRR